MIGNHNGPTKCSQILYYFQLYLFSQRLFKGKGVATHNIYTKHDIKLWEGAMIIDLMLLTFHIKLWQGVTFRERLAS